MGYQYGNNNYFGTTDGQKPLSLLNETLVGDGNSLSPAFMSLMNDQTRTPLGLIQEDFPATPSSLYSNRLLTEDVRFETDMKVAELKVVSITDDSNSSFLPGNGRNTTGTVLPNSAVDDPLEQAAKSLQSLYVSNPVSFLLISRFCYDFILI